MCHSGCSELAYQTRLGLNMKPIQKTRLRELLFRVSVMLKGIDALLEIVGGIALWLVTPEYIARAVQFLTQDEIAEDPHDLVVNLLRHGASRFSLASEHFMAFYLLAHGIVKALVVAALFRNKHWAYPSAIVVFGGFIVYQIYRLVMRGGAGLIALSIFDLIVIWLIWLEYRAVKSRTAL